MDLWRWRPAVTPKPNVRMGGIGDIEREEDIAFQQKENAARRAHAPLAPGIVIRNKQRSALEQLQVQVDAPLRTYLEKQPHSAMDVSLAE